ncbi:CD2 antigen cytoplasmic tail-binding protein 2 [Hypsizygus marmoreus]|uniref:CD2 antigen cytoplasmic tail-binding protein 2 n=1 Tax=Hypsizygus marmoreus TaxID=39966 RepID=A0A369JL21_HYPMA|nr:CD2 antigen cytoplasmic tail-binding protein 2 [Hypsizygus marmoreus]
MPPRTSQKRAAGPNGEASTSSRHAPKKTRFVEPSEDPANFAEEVESALETPAARRKGRVKNEGYESDSSDEGEGVVRSRKKDVAGDDDDEDMFAMGEKEEKQKETGKKKEEYLRLGDIEGQEFNSGSEDDLDDEPEDEDDAERRKKAGMGYELSSFNMRDEMEEGKFTEDGSYVRSFDPHGVHDRWMEGLGEREIKLARRRKRQQEKEQKERIEAEERELEESGGKGVLEKELLPMLKKGETVLEALHRLGVQAKKDRANNKTAKTKHIETDAMNVDKPVKPPTDIEKITHLASNIMSLGETDIYSKTYEELVRAVRASGSVPESWEPPSADVRYEYKWDVPSATQSTDVFGPFGEEEMKAWMKASYFGLAGEKIKVRRVGGEWGDWDDVIIT